MTGRTGHDISPEVERRPSMWNICPPPGVYRLLEHIHRDRYNRERAATITTDDGASWPVDLGEAGC